MDFTYELKDENLAEKGPVDIFTKDLLDLTGDDKLDSITLDMKKVEIVGSFCIGTIVAAFKTMDSKSGRLILKNVNDRIKKNLKVFGLSDILNIE